MVEYRPFVDRIRVMADTAAHAQVTLLAAAIAFYALLSVVPLAVVIVAGAATLGGDRVIDPLVSTFDHLISDEAVEIVRTGLEADAGASGATLVGVVFASWGALRVFRGLDRAFNTVYREPVASTPLETVVNGVSVLLSVLGIVVAVGIAVYALLAVGVTLPSVGVPLLTLPLVALMLLPMYALFPPGPAMLEPAIPGAVVAALGITLATAGMQLYVALAAPFAVYGVLAGVFIAMLWLYVIAVAVLLGAVANATEFGAYRQLHVDRAS